MTALERYRQAFAIYARRLIPGGTSGGAAVRLGGGTAIAQGLSVLTAPLLTRLYQPTELGTFGLLVTFVNFATVGLTLRYDMAIVSAATDVEADRLLILSSAVAIPMAALSALLLGGLIYAKALSFGQVPLSSALIVFLILIVSGIFGAARYWVVRIGDFGTVARCSMAQGLGRATTPIIAGALGAGWWGLMLGEIAGRVLGVSPLLRASFPRVRLTLRQSTLRAIQSVGAVNWRYPAIVAPSAVLDALGAALPLPLVASAFGVAEAGQLLIVQRLVGVPATLIGSSVADVFHSKISAIFRETPGEVKRAVLKTAGKLSLIAAAIYVPIAVVSPFTFGLVFGAQWKQAGFLVAVFTPLSISVLAISPVTRLYAVVNRPELKLFYDVGSIVVALISFILLPRFEYGFWLCTGVYACLTALLMLGQLGLAIYAASLPPRERNFATTTL